MRTGRTRAGRLGSTRKDIGLRDYRPFDRKFVIYLVHIEPAFRHARHYVGSCEAALLPARMRRHTRGQGARLLRAALASGHNLTLARVWLAASRNLEKEIKASGHVKARCPICTPGLTGTRPRKIIALPNRLPLNSHWTAAEWAKPAPPYKPKP